jgi:hypothetical protein
MPRLHFHGVEQAEGIMTKRNPVSKRLRFEIFKRDGFACVYCGRSPAASPLHVDHVVPVEGGGSSKPENLVSACEDCNQGKSSVPLEEKKLRALAVVSKKRQREHADQVRAFIENEKRLEAQRSETADLLADSWEERLGPISQQTYSRLKSLVAADPVTAVLQAITITGAKFKKVEEFSGREDLARLKYFSGVMRNWRTNGRFGF